MSGYIRDIQGVMQTDRTSAVEGLQSLEGRLVTAAATEAMQMRTNMAKLTGDVTALVADHAERLEAAQLKAQAQLEQQMQQTHREQTTALEAFQQTIQRTGREQTSELEARFDKFKGSVSGRVTEFHTALLLLDRRVDELSTQINSILKTVVIVK